MVYARERKMGRTETADKRGRGQKLEVRREEEEQVIISVGPGEAGRDCKRGPRVTVVSLQFSPFSCVSENIPAPSRRRKDPRHSHGSRQNPLTERPRPRTRAGDNHSEVTLSPSPKWPAAPGGGLVLRPPGPVRPEPALP